MGSLSNVFESRQAEGLANVLAIGTANPTNCHYQADYPDFYFEVTKSEHLADLKEKFKRICERSGIKKRHMHLTEDLIKENPNLAIYRAASFDARQDIMVTEVPKLGKEAALKAIKEWGQPISRITHLVFCTSSGINMPGADYQLVKLLGLSHSVQRYMIYQQGCNGGGTALRLAKDLAENNAGNRVLIVCSELSALLTFHAPSETHLDVLVGSAIFADGAAAAIVGADPDTTHERPLFQIAAAIQTLIPDSDDNVIAKTREMGVEYYLSKNTPKTVAKNTEQALLAMLEQYSTSPIRINNWNELFYVIHPGGPAVLRGVEESLRLEEDKLKTSWNVLSEYGNMWSSTVLFVLDEMRKKSMEEGKATTGDGLEWGVLLGFGPGLTLETVLLRSFAVESAN